MSGKQLAASEEGSKVRPGQMVLGDHAVEISLSLLVLPLHLVVGLGVEPKKHNDSGPYHCANLPPKYGG